MAKIGKSIDINVPVRTAYNQWTQFEDFPRFMEGIKEIRQLDNKPHAAERMLHGAACPAQAGRLRAGDRRVPEGPRIIQAAQAPSAWIRKKWMTK